MLDMALSQFSVGALGSYRMRHEQLPVDGGYDAEGRLTRDPAAIEASRRLLPAGFWKGSGLALVLDMVAAILSGGRATHEIPTDPEEETGLSQMFIAYDPSAFSAPGATEAIAERIIEDLHRPSRSGERVRYPGERTLATRIRNLQEGIPVEPAIWEAVQGL